MGEDDDPVVFEIDTDLLEEENFFPDEDFIAQGLKDIKNHAKYRKDLERYQCHWKLSVEKLGNCCYKGVIPAKAITRYCVLSRKRLDLIGQMLDPSISLGNFLVLGTWYNNLVKYMFGDIFEIPDKFSGIGVRPIAEDDEFSRMMQMHDEARIKQSKNREGITVKEVCHETI